MAIPTPDTYFTDPKEKELALLVWEEGKKRLAQGWWKSPMTPAYLAIESTPNVRILLTASDWMSYNRGEGQIEYIAEINQHFQKPDLYFSQEACANVEHVFRAAYMAIILTPAGGFLSSGAWELVIDPFIKEPLARAARAYNANSGRNAFYAVWEQLRLFGIVSHLPDSFKRNGSQFAYIDMKGWRMASDYWNALATDQANYGPGAPEFDARAQLEKLKLGIKALNGSLNAQKNRPPPSAPAPPAPPAIDPADFLADTPPTPSGTMLSKISKERYGTFELWPLIWKYNAKAIGNNPNRVPVGTVLKIKKKEKFTSDELKFARENWKNWAALN